MKKLLLLTVLFLSTISNVQAQVLYSNEFNAGTGLSVIDADGDANNWGLYLGSATTAGWGITGNFAGSRSWNPATGVPAGPLTPNNYLITPTIDIPSTFDAISLTFKVGSADLTYFAEQVSIYVISPTDNTPALIEALTPVFNLTLDATNARTALLQTVDISAYAGQTVRIAMRHHDCVDLNILFLDDLAVTQIPLATEDFVASKFSVFPNPANSSITVRNSAGISLNQVSLVDLNGRVIKQAQYNNISETKIDVSDLATGMYMLNIASDKGLVTKKFMKN